MNKKELSLKFTHGLGDAVQFTAVLKQLEASGIYSDITLKSLYGKHTCFHSEKTRNILSTEDAYAGQPDLYSVVWSEPPNSNLVGVPCTKVEFCLLNEFGIKPTLDSCRYSIHVSSEILGMVTDSIKNVAKTRGLSDKYSVLHYQGNTSTANKNLTEEEARSAVDAAYDLGVFTLLLDWDDRSPLVKDPRVVCFDGRNPIWNGMNTGSADVIAAIIQRSSGGVYVDSGPHKLALAVSSSCIAIWVRHHPINYSCPSDTVTNILPMYHWGLCKGTLSTDARQFFVDNYKFIVDGNRKLCIRNSVHDMLTVGKISRRRLSYLASRKELNVMDYTAKGAWQAEYSDCLLSLVPKFGRWLDFGCAAGAITSTLYDRGVNILGVDIDDELIKKGNELWGDTPLMLLPDGSLAGLQGDSFNVIHSQQVLEHIPESLVPKTFSEFYRIASPGCILILFYASTSGDMGHDPTHVCLKPPAWWLKQVTDAGWETDSLLYEKVINSSFPKRYKEWSTIVCVKPGKKEPNMSDAPKEKTENSVSFSRLTGTHLYDNRTKILAVYPELTSVMDTAAGQIAAAKCSGCARNKYTHAITTTLMKIPYDGRDLSSLLTVVGSQGIKALQHVTVARQADKSASRAPTQDNSPIIIPRPECQECVQKHLAACLVLLTECVNGYPEHLQHAVAHYEEARAEGFRGKLDFSNLDKTREILMKMTQAASLRTRLTGTLTILEELADSTLAGKIREVRLLLDPKNEK